MAAPLNQRSELALGRERPSFLYSDLGLDQPSIAVACNVSRRALAEAIAGFGLKRSRPAHGEYSVRVFDELARRIGLGHHPFSGIEPGAEWSVMREILGRGVIRMMREDPSRWWLVEAYLGQVPHTLAASRARLTEARLRFLHGDVGMSASDIALVLDASWSSVQAALRERGIRRHETFDEDLNEGILTELAHRLGRADWPMDRAPGGHRYWPTVKKGVRSGILLLAEEHALDLAALDRFLADVPAIASNRRGNAAPRAAAGEGASEIDQAA